VAKVLVVDDQEPVRDLCSRMLTVRGHEVLSVGSGAEAVALYDQLRPDAVLLDVDMPGMDGLATLGALRALDPEARVAMLTGNAGGGTIRGALALGARDYVLKPFQGRRLAEALVRLLAT
jgi:CheY-like chemotaxis protein